MPRYVIINLGLTDDVAHETGPHSDAMERALEQTDKRQQILFDTLKKAGVFDSTLFVFTSDHGQCLQDVQRSKGFEDPLRKAGIRFKSTYAFVYLLTFDVTLSTKKFALGKETTLDVTVRDDDTKEPVAGATVTIESGAAKGTAVTDAAGKASVTFTPMESRTTLTVRDDEKLPEEQKHNDFVKTY
jgi:hypothetical protein